MNESGVYLIMISITVLTARGSTGRALVINRSLLSRHNCEAERCRW